MNEKQQAETILRKVLDWVRHLPDCAISKTPREPCTCGLQSMLGAAAELIEAAESPAYLILYDDRDRKPEVFWGTGSEQGARLRFDQISLQWSAHLFQRVGSNSVDAGRCFSAGCKNLSMDGGLLCKKHYDELPPALRGD